MIHCAQPKEMIVLISVLKAVFNGYLCFADAFGAIQTTRCLYFRSSSSLTRISSNNSSRPTKKGFLSYGTRNIRFVEIVSEPRGAIQGVILDFEGLGWSLYVSLPDDIGYVHTVRSYRHLIFGTQAAYQSS